MGESFMTSFLSLPAPDINLPLPPDRFNSDSHETEATIFHLPKNISHKNTKRGESIWGAWFFFNHYFKPTLLDKSKDKSDLKLESFLVQHDMENLYMWAFKEKPDNALGKMQLRSYMNGHSRIGEPQFPFSADKGFVRSHRMQRKQYKGLSNPQCIHGVEVMTSPDLSVVAEADQNKWAELTGRDANFPLPPDAFDFNAWRNIPCGDIEIERHPPLNLFKNHEGHDMMILSPQSQKRRKDSPPHVMEEDCCLPRDNEAPWINNFSGVMRHVCGPVTAAKTIYEDDNGYLIVVTLPFSDQHRVKVCWRNGASHGIVKISGISTARMPCIKRHERIFKLTDPCPEHCPPGEFIREIPLPSRIPEDARMEAYYDESGTVLEIMVPKHGNEPEEHEVRVSMRPPHLGENDLMLT